MVLQDVGVRKDSGLRITVCLILTVPIIVAAILFWCLYVQEFRYEYLLNNGVEVEATVVDYKYYYQSNTGENDHSSSGWYYFWECYYNGRIYSGIDGPFATEDIVSKYLGTMFTVTVDPDSSFAVDMSKTEIRANGFHYVEFLACAITFTCLSPLFIFAFIKFAIYPEILNGKIDRCGKLPAQGEVIKVKGLLFKYIKVRFEEKGEIKEKWSYDWFTRKETELLQHKKTITIVLYKNTFGILEEMIK